MNFLRNLAPGQKRALMVGAPIVAVLALVQVIRRPAPAETPDPTEPTADDASAPVSFPGYVMPTTDAIGTGPLMDLMTQINQNQAQFLADLTDRLGAQEDTVTPPAPPTPPTTPVTPPPPTLPPATPKPAPPTPAPKPPAPAPYSPHTDAQLGKRTSVVKAGGETIGALSARLYTDAKWWQELYWINAAAWNDYAESKGQRITASSFVIPGGMIARY